ncbi:MAG: hypothetical protein R3E86_22385 [Pseudomonadales bacterium]
MAFSALLLAVLGAAASATVPVGLTDPTRPLRGTSSAPGKVDTGEVPQLTSVLISAERRLAVIGGAVLQEGEERDGLKVWKISADRVVISVAGRDPVTLLLDEARIDKDLR